VARTVRRLDDEGAGTLVSFIVAMAVFTIAFSAIAATLANHVAREGGTSGSAADAHALASDALRFVTTQPGHPSTWPSGGVTRLGFLKPGSIATLDGARVVALATTYGDQPDYVEARKALGLPEGRNFRIEVRPSVPIQPSGSIPALQDLRVAYVANGTGVFGELAPQAHAEIAALKAAGVVLDGRFADGALATAGDVYTSEFTLQNLVFRLAGLEGFPAPSIASAWQMRDKNAFAPANAPWPAAAPQSFLMYASTTTADEYRYARNAWPGLLRVSSLDLSGFGSGARVWLNFTHYIKASSTIADGAGFTPGFDDYARVSTYCTSCAGPLVNWEMQGTHLHTNGSRAAPESASISLTHLVGDVHDLSFDFLQSPQPQTSEGEGWFVHAITVEASEAGVKTVLYSNAMDYDTTRYDALVVGTNAVATPSAGVRPQWREGLARWIEKGGNLVMLGDAEKDPLAWWDELLPHRNVGTVTLPFALRTTYQHPILTRPYALATGGYDAAAAPWPWADEMQAFLTMIDPLDISKQQPVAAVTGYNADPAGAILATNLRPLDASATQLRHLFSNALLYLTHQQYYVDYGPAVPRGAGVGSATGTFLLDGRDSGLGVVEAQIVLYVW